jgi:hypothetical protein
MRECHPFPFSPMKTLKISGKIGEKKKLISFCGEWKYSIFDKVKTNTH